MASIRSASNILRPIVVLAVFAAVLLPPRAGAITPLNPTTSDNAPRSTIPVCVEGFGIFQDDAVDRVEDAIDEWETIRGIRGGQAVSITFEGEDCDTDHVHIVPRTGGVPAQAFPGPVTTDYGDSDEGAIAFNFGLNWEYDNVAPASDEYSFLGVVTHELGHIFGSDHVGNYNWSPIDSAAPTMTDVGGIGTDTWWVRTLQGDDWGLGVWVQSVGEAHWNPDPGFEEYSDYWTKINNAVTGTEGKKTGLHGAKLPDSGDAIKAEVTWDPWGVDLGESEVFEADRELTGSNLLNDDVHADAQYKFSASATNDLKIHIRTRTDWVNLYKDLDDSDTPNSLAEVLKKHDDSFSPSGWTSWTEVASCDSSTTWATCTSSAFTLTHSSGWTVVGGEDTFRVLIQQVEIRFKNGSGKIVYLDEAGIYGGYVED